ncbi:gibberellin 2-beta-dioxygenase 7 [Quercus suber]|uniref:Gibberellin 2-beta-dioxygenase 7 n=1 Tax=Quercus suber TaxID=58331 RepID=A0AAW0K457_QUESU
MDYEPPFQETYKNFLQNSFDESEDKNLFMVEECELPLINLSQLNLEQLVREKCIKEIAQAARQWGFFQVVNHGIPQEILNNLQYEQKMPPFQETYKNFLQNSFDESEDKNLFMVEECELPLINLSQLNLEQLVREKCIKEIAQAARQWGFFQVVNHGIPQEILNNLQYEQKMVFHLPFEKKAEEKFLNLSTNSYRWGNPEATSLKQVPWSETLHISLADISRMDKRNSLSLYLWQCVKILGWIFIYCESKFFGFDDQAVRVLMVNLELAWLELMRLVMVFDWSLAASNGFVPVASVFYRFSITSNWKWVREERSLWILSRI